MSKSFNEARALQYDPWGSDDGEMRLLQDKIVTSRGGQKCHQCGVEIQKGERIRSRREVFDGDFMAFRWCQICTSLMAEEDTAALDARSQTSPTHP